jgi:hypothetical protein
MRKPSKSSFQDWPRKTAEAMFVVLTTKYRRTRGRRPSLSFKGESNPHRALVLANEALLQYTPQIGENMETTSERIVRIMEVTNAPCIVDWAGYNVLVNPSTKPIEIQQAFVHAMHVGHERWATSPEGQKHLAAEKAHLEHLQEQVNAAMELLEHLDFGELAAVINWLELIHDGACRSLEVQVPCEKILEVLRSHGFEAGVNCNEQFDGQNEDNFGRYVIGVAMKQGCRIIRKHAREWRERFCQVYDFVEIVAAAARRQPENELLRSWLRGPKHAVSDPSSQELIDFLSREYPSNSTQLRVIMICAQQDLSRIPFDSARSKTFFSRAYKYWHATQTPSSLESLAEAETLLGFLRERIPESQLCELAEKFPDVKSVTELCDAHGLEHHFTSTNGNRYTVLDSNLETKRGFDLWVEIYHQSALGWVVRYQDLVDAAGFSPANS